MAVLSGENKAKRDSYRGCVMCICACRIRRIPRMSHTPISEPNIEDL